MRNNLVVALLGMLALAACDPVIRKFEVTPPQLPCAGPVTVAWDVSGPGGQLSTSAPVIPPLLSNPPEQGSQVVTVTESTEFSLVIPGAGHKHRTVAITGTPQAKTLTFTGQCNDAFTGPAYETIIVGAADAPGKLTSIRATNTDWPVHVFVNGTEIDLGADGLPIFPLPDTTAAGSYSVQVPGLPGTAICKDAVEGGGPLGGGTAPAPAITLEIKGSCS